MQLDAINLADFLSPGALFAEKYRILSVLGQGGMGVVYKAEHLLMQRIVALKTVLTSLTANSQAAYRFQQEAKAASSLSHPNIVGVHDFGIADGNAYLVMDYLEGRTLSHDQLEFDRFIHIFKQACGALDHAHKRGIIHRDLKCGNLMLVQVEDDRDFLKLVDFGLAKIIAPERGSELQSLTTTGMIVGSPLYMSPEQCRGRDLDPRSDIYSLGCVMYEALVGEPPFVGETALDTMCQHLSQTAPSMLELNPDIDPRLDKLVAQMLHKDPNMRPQSMSAVAHQLDISPMPSRVRQPARTSGRGRRLPPMDAKATGASRSFVALPAADNSAQIWQGALLSILLVAAGGFGAIALYGQAPRVSANLAPAGHPDMSASMHQTKDAAVLAKRLAGQRRAELTAQLASERAKVSAYHAKNALANHMNTDSKPLSVAHFKHMDPYTEYDLPRPDSAPPPLAALPALPSPTSMAPPLSSLRSLSAQSSPERPLRDVFRQAAERFRAPVQYYGDRTSPSPDAPGRGRWEAPLGSVTAVAETAVSCERNGKFEEAKRLYESIRSALKNDPKVLGPRPYLFEGLANIANHMQYLDDAAFLREACPRKFEMRR